MLNEISVENLNRADELLHKARNIKAAIKDNFAEPSADGVAKDASFQDGIQQRLEDENAKLKQAYSVLKDIEDLLFGYHVEDELPKAPRQDVF